MGLYGYIKNILKGLTNDFNSKVGRLMNILYFTQKSSNDDFLLGIVGKIGSVTLCNDVDMKTIKENISSYDLIIIRELYELLKYEIISNHRNVIVVPDICDVSNSNISDFLIGFKDIKFLCFSSYVYSFFTKHNENCFYIQYYPNASSDSSNMEKKQFEAIIDDVNSISISETSYLLKNLSLRDFVINNKSKSDESTINQIVTTFSDIYDIKTLSLNINYCNSTEKQFVFVVSSKDTFFDFDFLRMMNLGICIVAPNKAPFNEYISNGTTGYLYNPYELYPLFLDDLVNTANMGKKSVSIGNERWNENYENLINYIVNDIKSKTFKLYSMWETEGTKNRTSMKKDDSPKISVVTVCRNAGNEIEKTINSIINQDYLNMEYVILDGASTDNTIDIIKKYNAQIDYWHSKPDSGVYSTMIDSLDYVSGQFVIFMNAGDSFVSNDALSRMFANVPNHVSVVFGHHIYTREDGIDEIHVAADFDVTWFRLKNGYLDYDWLSGIPCHQTVAVQVDILRKYKFDPNYTIAADHEFYFRIRQDGHTFHNSNELIAVYVGGGFSSKKLSTCIDEWGKIAKNYGIIEASNVFYKKFRNSLYPVLSINQPKFRLIIKKCFANSKIVKKMLHLYKHYNSNKHKNVYWSNLEDGIMMFRQGMPSFVKSMTGFSEAESWGRWTIKKRSYIIFNKSLPIKFELTISGYAFGENIGKAVVIIVGRQKYSCIMQGFPCKEYKILIENHDNSNLLELRTFAVKSPYDLYDKQSNDKRTLGVAISQINIRKV